MLRPGSVFPDHLQLGLARSRRPKCDWLVSPMDLENSRVLSASLGRMCGDGPGPSVPYSSAFGWCHDCSAVTVYLGWSSLHRHCSSQSLRKPLQLFCLAMLKRSWGFCRLSTPPHLLLRHDFSLLRSADHRRFDLGSDLTMESPRPNDDHIPPSLHS